MKRLILPGIPFALSFILSLSTAGAHCYWQDSGFFLVAVKELGVLYPPGFALYVLLCKAWTLAFWFVDFTYAVHLFSATCAAAAAGTLAVAIRDLLRTKGPIFRTVQEEGPLAEWVGASIGCLAASGYTFWAAAILAKVYAFYYLILTLLIWRMIRADESGKPRDFTWVAALIGLSWQAHPSASLIGLSLVLFVAHHRRGVGWKGVAWRSVLAALCAIGPIHLLPFFNYGRTSAIQFGTPWTLDGFWDYLTGTRFISQPGAFGVESSRIASVGRYFWEEFLGVGLLLVAFGAYRLWPLNRRLLLGLAAWIVPVIAITVLFKLEGQHDFWMVAAWIPLWMVAAVGLSGVGRLREAAVALSLVGTIWAVGANRKDLDQREYTLAESFGRTLLDPAETGSCLALESDDSLAITLFLQKIRGYKVDAYIIPGHADREGYFGERPPDPGVFATPAGPLFRYSGVPGHPIDLKYWREPIAAEDVVRLYRRERGQFLERDAEGIHVRPEAYEKRLLRLLLRARKNLADIRAQERNFPEVVRLCESILALDPWMHEEPTVVFSLAVARAGLQRYVEAEATFKRALELKLTAAKRAEAYYFLTALCGNRPEASEWKAKALASPDLPLELRRKLEGR